MADVSANEVRLFFKNADPEIAELVYELAGETIKSRRALSSKISENMKKARQARGKGKAKASTEATQEQATETATPANNQSQPSQATDSPILAARARRAAAGSIPSVPAPSHTADATSAESDVTIDG